MVVFVADPKYLANSKLLNHNILLPFQAPPRLRPKITGKNRNQMIDLARKTQMMFKKNDDSDWAKLYFFEAFLVLIETWKVLKIYSVN